MSTVERLRKYRERRAAGRRIYQLDLPEVALEFMLQCAGQLSSGLFSVLSGTMDAADTVSAHILERPNLLRSSESIALVAAGERVDGKESPERRLIKERGVSYVQASQDLGVRGSQLRDWVKKFADDPEHAFPGHGQMKPEQLEIARLKREVTKLKAERDILKKVRGSFSSCGHRNGLRYVLSAPRGAAVGFLVVSTP
jgi:transposase